MIIDILKTTWRFFWVTVVVLGTIGTAVYLYYSAKDND